MGTEKSNARERLQSKKELQMKKLVLAFCVLSLAGCGPSREEMVKTIEDEYSVLDYDVLKVEQDLLTQMVAEQEKSLAAMNAASIAVGLLSIATTGSGGFSTSSSKHLEEDKLRLEALTNLVDEGSYNYN